MVDISVDCGAKALMIYHHDPSRTDEEIDRILEMARIRADRRMESHLNRPQDFRTYASYDGLALQYSLDVKRFELVQNGF